MPLQDTLKEKKRTCKLELLAIFLKPGLQASLLVPGFLSLNVQTRYISMELQTVSTPDNILAAK